MTEYVLREFICKHCGHTVVVNPNLPADYTPNVCTPCWTNIVEPENRRRGDALMTEAVKLLRLCGGRSAEAVNRASVSRETSGPL